MNEAYEADRQMSEEYLRKELDEIAALKGEVYLRALREADKPSLLTWRNDPVVRQFSRNQDLITPESHEKWWFSLPLRRTFKPFGIALKGETIGLCSLYLESDNKAEFSIHLSPAVRGRGHGVAAMRILLRYGFESLGLDLIWGETFETNVAGRQTFKRAGLYVDAYLRERFLRDGKRIGTYVLSLTKDEWNSLPQPSSP